MSAPPGPLRGVRVLDLAGISGAYCTKLLADLHADVRTIEPPGGAAMRGIGPFASTTPDPNQSLFFWHYSTNKRSAVLDLESETDRVQLLALASRADVLVETFAPGYLEARGLSYERLSAHNSGLIVVSITPFGQSGPARDHHSSDLVAQAAGGMVYLNGPPDGAPLQGLGLQAYHSASIVGALGTLLALHARARSGRGQWVDVSLQECVAACMEHASAAFHQDGTIAERRGSLHWTGDFRVTRCRDGYALHGILGDWTSLIEWVQADGKAADLSRPEWQDHRHRRSHCAHLFDVLDGWAAEYATAALVDGAQLRRLPYAPVRSVQDLIADPQLQARGFFVPVWHGDLGCGVRYPGAPYQLERTPWSIRRRPPRCGEHQAALQDWFDASPPVSRAHTAVERTDARALDGLRVIDFTWVVAGPVATRVLADHGAEVIKIERRGATDFGNRRGGLTGNLHRGKRSIVIDMNHPDGVALARRLIAAADVVVDNFSARVMHNWGLDPDSLRALKADLIVLTMSGFGHTGPYRDHVSYGPTLQALAGYTQGMRHLDGQPTGWGFSYADMAAGYSGALAVLAALWHRRRTGEGQWIDLSQYENLVALLGPHLLAALRHIAPSAIDNRSQEMPSAPHGVYRCADAPGIGPARDRWVAIVVVGDLKWQGFGAALGQPAWIRDQRFATVSSRCAHQTALDAAVQAWTRVRHAEAVVARLQRWGIAAAVVSNAADLCQRDAQLQSRQYWIDMPTPEGETMRLDGIPLKLSATPGRVTAAGPLLGEHTDLVLSQVLGMGSAEIDALRAARIVA